jgi:hypothetical protein
MTWYRDIDLKTLQILYTDELKAIEGDIEYGYELKYNYIRYCYFSILLTQLIGGAPRLSEATEAIKRFYDTGERIQLVRLRKTKKRKPKRYRHIVIPSIIERENLRHIDNCYKDNTNYDSFKPANISSWIIKYAKKNWDMELNTHTNRYAAITHYILEEKMNPIEVQQITKHTDLNLISHYTSDKKAKDNLITLSKKMVE